MVEYNKDEVIKICLESLSMGEAARTLGLPRTTLGRIARKLGCYFPNQGLKGGVKPWKNGKIKTEDVLVGKYPHYKLRVNKLVEEGYFEYECAVCKISEWQGKKLTLELEHIDGDSTNHKFDNLKLLCPNCHSQTSTFRNKKRQNNAGMS